MLSCDSGFAVDGKATVNMTCSNDAEWPAKPWPATEMDVWQLLTGGVRTSMTVHCSFMGGSALSLPI